MSKIAISGASTGTATFTIESPATSTNRTLTLPDNTGTIITQNSTPAFASTIGVGGATAAASGAGITFPASQSASSDANTLDDYEEGTWTPTLSSGFSTAPTSYTINGGIYTKVGRIVFFALHLLPVGAVANASPVAITGLPFSNGSTTAHRFGGVVSYQSGFDTNAGDNWHLGGGNNTLELYNSAGAGRAGNSAGVNINERVQLYGFYMVA